MVSASTVKAIHQGFMCPVLTINALDEFMDDQLFKLSSGASVASSSTSGSVLVVAVLHQWSGS